MKLRYASLPAAGEKRGTAMCSNQTWTSSQLAMDCMQRLCLELVQPPQLAANKKNAGAE